MSVECENYILQTEAILRDYIRHKVIRNEEFKARADFVKKVEFSSAPSLHLDGRILEIVRALAFEFERRYRDSYRSQLSEMPYEMALSEDPAVARLSFDSVTSELFQGGWQWARVIAVIAYVGLLVEASIAHCDCEIETRVRQIIAWTMTFFQSPDARVFFLSSGGWNGFLEWYGGKEAASLAHGTPLPKQVAVVGVVAAVMAGLSFMVGRFVS